MESCVLYFGGDYLSLTIAKQSVNKTYIKKAEARVPFGGIVNGEFVDVDELPSAFAGLIEKIGSTHLGTLTVGVPSCFVSVTSDEQKLTFAKPHKITERDTADLIGDGRAVYYRIDGDKPVINPVGSVVQHELLAGISYITISQSFCDVLRKFAAMTRAFKKINMIPVVLAEAKYQISQHTRDRTCVVISCKMLSTSVAAIMGDQIVAVETFHMGTAHVINDIMNFSHVDFATAKANYFGLKTTTAQMYPIAKARIDEIADQIRSIVKNIDNKLFERPFYILGGHIDAIVGCVEALEKSFGVTITPLVCPFTESNAPDKVSIDAVVNASFA